VPHLRACRHLLRGSSLPLQGLGLHPRPTGGDPVNSRISDNHHTLNTPNTTEPTPIQELSWHGLQDWICGVGVAWTQAEGWHLIDWGDGTTTPAHPDMPSRQHIYGGPCDNTTYTISARHLNRNGQTGPPAAQTTVQTRGRGNPGHNFYLHAD